MKLYDAPYGSTVRLLDKEPVVPPGAPAVECGREYHFDHIDGIYSVCFDEDGKLVHLSRWAEVEVVS